MASSNGKTYGKISQAQREILEDFYDGKFVVDDNGTLCIAMRSTRAHMKETIQAAARETGLSEEKIEVLYCMGSHFHGMDLLKHSIFARVLDTLFILANKNLGLFKIKVTRSTFEKRRTKI